MVRDIRFGMPFARGVVDRGSPVGVLVLDDGAFRDEEVDDLPETSVGGVEERGLVARVFGVNSGPFLQEKAHDRKRDLLAAAASGGRVKGRIAVRVFRLDELGVRLEEPRYGLEVSA
ncbi:MAG: hypothetical protein MUQ00_08040 [Candidatus Aminicenantes bacterium]|nr:hypothetical protein [Candidatus Aminicenantes bacterium]